MPTQPFYPPLSNLIPLDNWPEVIGKLQEELSSVLDKISYDQLTVEKTRAGDAANYRLNLVLSEELGIDIPGTNGMSLLINPGGNGGTSIPVSFKYSWELIRFIRGFKVSNFSEGAQSIFELLLDITQTSEEQLLGSAIMNFIDSPDPYAAFITNFNANYSPSTLLTFPSGDTDPAVGIMKQLKTFPNDFNIVEIILTEFILSGADFQAVMDNIAKIFKQWLGGITPESVKELIFPSYTVSLDNLFIGLRFPTTVVRKVDPVTNVPLQDTSGHDVPSILTFNLGSIEYSTETGFQFFDINQATLDFPKSEILKSGFTVMFDGIKVDLSRNTNIPEATADGRPEDFIGVYITEGSIGFPNDWGHNPVDSTAELFVSNLLAGTGGISGTIGMRPTGSGDALIQLKFGEKFKVSLSEFELVFQQNAIISSSIHGKLEIPGFKNEAGQQVVIDIDIHIGQNGEFNIVAAAEPQIKKIRVPNAFDFDIQSAFFGREAGSDGRFYLGVGGQLDIHPPAPLGSLLPDKLDIKKMLIYDDGKFEFEGGKITLPKAYTVNFGAATVSVTGIHSGNYEKNGRDYKYFGFDGGISVKPSAIDAQGKGIKFYYTVDDGSFDWFIRLESLKVDIIIPGGANPEDAAVAIKGFLSIAEPRIPDGATPEMIELLKSAQEYIGGVDVRIPKFRGLQASAAMRFTPKVPAFLIDLAIEMSTPIPLGATGLGIYGFRALLAKRYVASKGAAGIPADGEWWQYYKAKIDPDYKEGIQASKFDIKEGFSLGAGVSLATSSDSGKIFSSKLFFLLSLPDVFLFQGQAQFLKERISIDANPDPPFFAIIAITKHSIEAGFGVNYKLREDGKIVTVDGVIELGFFWGSSSSWYVNVGRETPEDRRIQARLFDILNMYFYLMISSGGLRLGAGVKFELSKKFGPISAELKAYIDTFGKFSKRPRQIGGAIKLGGTVGIKVCGLGFSVSGAATLAAEAPKPHVVTGEFEVCVKVLKKERCVRFELTWFFNEDLLMIPNSLIGANSGEEDARDINDVRKAAKMTNMVTGETYALSHTSASGSIPAPNTWITDGADDYRIPLDSFFDIEFKKGVNMVPTLGNNLGKIGGMSTPANYVEFVPPLRGKSDRVRHEYSLKDIEIFYWDEKASPAAAWKPYDFYSALLPMYENATGTVVEAIDPIALSNMKWGYWQQQAPGLNNKLRILATSPLSYTSTTGNAFNIEDMGVTDTTIFCPGEPIGHTCVTFNAKDEQRIFAADTLNSHQNVIFRLTQKDGVVLNGITNMYGLYIEPESTLEIFFNEPMKDVHLDLRSQATEVLLKYYQRQDGPVVNGLNTYTYALVGTQSEDPNNGMIYYTQPDGAFDKIEITVEECRTQKPLLCIPVSNLNKIQTDLFDFMKALVQQNHLTQPSVELYSQYETEYQDFFGSTLYPAHPEQGDQVMLTQGYYSPSGLSFTISDTHGFNCQYQLLVTNAPIGFTLADALTVASVVPASYSGGANNEWTVMFTTNRRYTYIECKLTTCKTIATCISDCSVGLYELCYLSLENYLLNETTAYTDQTAANTALFDTINKTLQPVWRPNTTYAIRLKTEDRMFREGQSTPGGLQVNADVYGFRTAGPIGHFHSYPVAGSSSIQRHDRADYHVLDLKGKQDEFRLSSLKSYIDYDKSYPNADGTLVNAKPLFYDNAQLRLFYLYNYVYQFYNDWVDHDHQPAKIAESSLEIKIIDPAPTANPPVQTATSFDANMIPHSLATGVPPSLIHSVNNDIALLNNLLAGGNPCADDVPLVPIDISSVKEMDLKPLKLYTAQFVAHYNARIRIGESFSTMPFSSVVHSYVFQTSRYANFAEQVHSYILQEESIDTELKEAIYPLQLSSATNYTFAAEVINNTLTPGQDAMKQQYANVFDRLVQGVFALDANALQTAATTEFNLLHSGGKLRGILIRNPEPFNNPKLPADQETLEVKRFNGTTFVNPEAFTILHSPDRSSIFITSSDMSFDMDAEASLQFRFSYKTYNGIGYDNASEEFIYINLSNYPF